MSAVKVTPSSTQQQSVNKEVALLLEQLDPLVGVAGGIHGTHEAERFVT